MFDLIMFKLSLQQRGDHDLGLLLFLCYDHPDEVDAIYEEIDRRQRMAST